MMAPRYLALRYGMGSVGAGLYSSVPGVLLLYYLTETLGLGAGAAALAIFLPKCLGALCDPLAGWLSDRTAGRFGRRVPWMLLGGLLMPASLAMLFSGAGSGMPSATFLFVIATYAVSALGYSLFAVPYLAMPAEITADPAVRLAIISRRMFFAMAGIMLGSALAPLLVKQFGGGIAGYRSMGICVALVSFLCIAVSTQLAYTLRGQGLATLGAPGIAAQFRSVLGNRAFMRLLGVFTLQTLAAAVFGALVPYAVDLAWGGDETQVGMLMFSLLTSSMLALSVWEIISRRWGQSRAFFSAALLYSFCLCPLLLLDGDSRMFSQVAVFAALGAGFAGLQLLPFSMAADLIHQHATAHGDRSEGTFTGAWTAFEKLALSMGAPLAAGVIALSGQIGSTGGSTFAADGVVYGMVLIPATAQLLSIILLLRPGAVAAAPVESSQ